MRQTRANLVPHGEQEDARIRQKGGTRMEHIPIAIVGCGGMGRRHLTGLNALYRSSYRNVELAAVCDVNRQNAEDLADEAAQMLGTRPVVFVDVQAIAQAL